MKQIYGCEQNTTVEDWWDLGDIKVSRCPLKIIDYNIYEVVRAYRRYEKGFLANDGGWADQAAKFMDFVDIIEAQQGVIAKKKAKESRQ